MTDLTPNLNQFAKLVNEAAKRIAPYIYQTPLEFSPALSQAGNCQVYLKCESLQRTGSFKIRGAANFILSLTEAERADGLVTASTGNHAAAFAYLVDRLGIDGTIYLPTNTAPTKLESLKQFKVRLELFGDDCLDAEQKAIEIASERSQVYLSPYNHIKIMAGQGTIALEILDELGEIGTLLCPVGGGGLASGVAATIKSRQPKTKIIGCQPENSKVMYESIRAGKILDLPSKLSLADGTAGGIEPGCLTFDYCRELIDDFVIVSEAEIRAAMRLILEKHQLLIEGAASLSVAALLKSGRQFAGQKVVLVLSGRRVSIATIRSLLGD